MVAIPIPGTRVAEFCRHHHIRRLALFGSVLTDAFTTQSDVDVLVEFEPGRVPGYGFITIQNNLSHLFEGHPVDLFTENSLHPLLRDGILRDAKTIYAR